MNMKTTHLVRGAGRSWLSVGLIAGLFLAAADLGVVGLFREIIEGWGSTGEGLTRILLFLMALGFLRAGGQFLVRHSATAASEHIGADLRIRGLEMLLCARGPEKVSAGHLHHEINEIFPKAALYFRQLVNCLGIGLHLLFLALFLFYVAPREAALGLGGLSVVFVLVLLVHKRTAKIAVGIPDAHHRLSKGIDRVANNWMLIRMLRRGREEHRALAQDVMDYARTVRAASLAIHLAAALPTILGLFVLCGALYFGLAYWGESGPTMLAFTYLFIRFVQGSAQLASAWGAAVALAPQVARARDLLRCTTEQRPESSHSIVRDLAKAPGVTVSEISFRYGEGPELFGDMSWSLNPGERCVITGPSGSGKSTLVAILAGLISPDAGHVEIDGMDPREYMALSGAQVAYVSATPFLVDGSLRANLCYGRDKTPSDERLRDALEQVQLSERVFSSELGLDTPVDPSGFPFSLGEQQRICLARALVAQPRILFLDEMTASLDSESQSAIIQMLLSMTIESTLIWATHRVHLGTGADTWVKLGKTPQKT
jgi:ABC-type multidrug transport system fused ATPase/permease subunit